MLLSLLQRWLYSLVLRLGTPFYMARLWWLGREEPLYRKRLGERLARYELPPRRGLGGVIWLHIGSLSQTRGARPLVHALRRELPNERLLLTCGSVEAVRAGVDLLDPEDDQAWLPYDTPGAARRFLRRYRPAVGVVMESGVWPNLMRQAQSMHLPMVLVNARLSTRSLRRGRRWRHLLVPAVQAFARVLAQTPRDAQHWKEVGARSVEVCGNTKLDHGPAARLLQHGQGWRTLIGRPVVLMSGSREGEDEGLLEAWRALPAPRPLLIVAPQDGSRSDEVAEAAERCGFGVARRAEWGEEPTARVLDADVWIGDQAHEAALYLALADVALLGGSFAPLGGDDPMAAAACGCPLLIGQHTYAHDEAIELAVEAGAAARMKDLPSAVRRAVALVHDARRKDWSDQALAFAAAHRGANERVAQRISMLLTGLDSTR